MYKVTGQSTAYLRIKIFCMVQMLLSTGWLGVRIRLSNNMWMLQQFPPLCEKANTVAVSGEALLSQYPYCCIPNALCAVSLITERVGCNSCYSFIQTFCAVMLSAYISLSFCRLPLQLFLSDLFITWMLVYERWLAAQSGKLYLPRKGCTIERFKFFI